LGVSIIVTSLDLDIHRVVYDDGKEGTTGEFQRNEAIISQRDGEIQNLTNCFIDTPDQANSFHANHTCYISITLRRDVTGTTHIFYELSGFYQNHRRFVSSIDRTQFTDEWRPGIPLPACAPMENVVSAACIAGNCNHPVKTRQVFPCGLVANTMFNDIFWLHEGILPDGSRLTRKDLQQNNIARKYVGHNFKNPSWNYSLDEYLPVWNNPNLSRIIPPLYGDRSPHITKDYTNSTAWVEEPSMDNIGLENEHWRVWVELAANQPFRKTYGKIEKNLPAGTKLIFAVQSNFFVRSFGGSKALVLAKISWFGSENYTLGGFFLMTSLIFFIATVFFSIRACKNPRPLGNASALAWKHPQARQKIE
jgi:hypothetical protein